MVRVCGVGGEEGERECDYVSLLRCVSGVQRSRKPRDCGLRRQQLRGGRRRRRRGGRSTGWPNTGRDSRLRYIGLSRLYN